MTKEQEAIEKLTNGREEMDLITLIRKFKKEGIENFVVTKKEYIETVLSMLKEKDRQIERLKQTLTRNIARNVTASMKETAKSKEDLEMLNKGWQIELEKKKRQIDLMATTLSAICTGISTVREQFEKEYCEFMNCDEDCCWKTDTSCKDCIKQYIERKSKE